MKSSGRAGSHPYKWKIRSHFTTISNFIIAASTSTPFLCGKNTQSHNTSVLIHNQAGNSRAGAPSFKTFERLLDKSEKKNLTNILNLTKHLEFESKAAGPSRAGARGPTTHSPSPLVLLGGGGPAPAQTFLHKFP